VSKILEPFSQKFVRFKKPIERKSILFGVALSKKPAFWQASRLPNIVCTGQVRASPTLEGIPPRKPGSPFGIFPPNPALAGKTCRWALAQ
jgi:hypothetical protein